MSVDPQSEKSSENEGPVLTRGALGPNRGGAGAKKRFLGERSLTITASWEDFDVPEGEIIPPTLEHVEGMHHCLEKVGKPSKRHQNHANLDKFL